MIAPTLAFAPGAETATLPAGLRPPAATDFAALLGFADPVLPAAPGAPPPPPEKQSIAPGADPMVAAESEAVALIAQIAPPLLPQPAADRAPPLLPQPAVPSALPLISSQPAAEPALPLTPQPAVPSAPPLASSQPAAEPALPEPGAEPALPPLPQPGAAPALLLMSQPAAPPAPPSRPAGAAEAVPRQTPEPDGSTSNLPAGVERRRESSNLSFMPRAQPARTVRIDAAMNHPAPALARPQAPSAEQPQAAAAGVRAVPETAPEPLARPAPAQPGVAASAPGLHLAEAAPVAVAIRDSVAMVPAVSPVRSEAPIGPLPETAAAPASIPLPKIATPVATVLLPATLAEPLAQTAPPPFAAAPALPDTPDAPADEAAPSPTSLAPSARPAGLARPRPAAVSPRHLAVAPDAGDVGNGAERQVAVDEPAPAVAPGSIAAVPDALIVPAAAAAPAAAVAQDPVPAAVPIDMPPAAVRQPAAPSPSASAIPVRAAPAPEPSERVAAAPAAKRVGTAAVAEAQSFGPVQAAAVATLDAPASVDARASAAPGEVLITRHLDLAQDHAWLDRLAQDIARSADQGSPLRFALAPEHLGRLTVEIASHADGTAIRLTTETEQARRIVADAQPRLIAEARAQGLRVTDAQVDLDQRSGGQPQHHGHQHPAATAQQATAGGGGGGNGGQSGGDRARPGLLRTELRRSVSRPAAAGAPAVRDLYA